MALTCREAVVPTPPDIVVTASSPEAAQRQYWRHVANRACLAILADHRHPALTARPGRPGATRGPNQPPRPVPGSNVFYVRAEPIQINDAVTRHLSLNLLVQPTQPGNILTLAALRDWPAATTTEPVFKYRSHLQTFERRTGITGDVIYLFELLLWPHAQDLLNAMTS